MPRLLISIWVARLKSESQARRFSPLQYPDVVKSILTEVVNAVDVPVTLKIRTGWAPEHRNCEEIAQLAEDCGIQALTIHGRTRACLFNGEAEYDSIPGS